eukprot:SAG22_NODE_62_length_23371_cov_84.500602_23_plen_256_part_00
MNGPTLEFQASVGFIWWLISQINYVGLISQINYVISQINHVGHVYYMYTYKFGLGCLRFRWFGGRCVWGVYTILQVSPLTLGVYTTSVSIAVSIIFETGQPLVTQKDPIPLYWYLVLPWSFRPKLRFDCMWRCFWDRAPLETARTAYSLSSRRSPISGGSSATRGQPYVIETYFLIVVTSYYSSSSSHHLDSDFSSGSLMAKSGVSESHSMDRRGRGAQNSCMHASRDEIASEFSLRILSRSYMYYCGAAERHWQ